MKYQALFSSKYKSTKLNCRLLQVLFGVLRVKTDCCFKLVVLDWMGSFILKVHDYSLDICYHPPLLSFFI